MFTFAVERSEECLRTYIIKHITIMERLIRKETSAMPKVGEKYWYVFSSMVSHSFELRQTEFFACESDFLRMAKGNCFVERKDAEEVIEQLNDYLVEIRESYKGRPGAIVDKSTDE